MQIRIMVQAVAAVQTRSVVTAAVPTAALAGQERHHLLQGRPLLVPAVVVAELIKAALLEPEAQAAAALQAHQMVVTALQVR
jgi:hypothetical protein